MQNLRCCLLLALLACCAPGRAQGTLIPVAFYPVQAAPFTLTIETRQDRLDENTPRVATRRILRDAAGRQRYEASMLDGVAKSSEVDIYDVVAAQFIKLDLGAKTALLSPMHVGPAVPLDVSIASSLAPTTLADGQTLLGTREIAGVEAWGEKTTQTIAREDGSTVTQDRELWISTHYRIPVMQIARGPQGKTTQLVTSFINADPDPSLFRIPEGFTVSNAPRIPEPAPGTFRVGGNVSAPVVLKAADPKFSEQARQARVGGQVLVYLILDERGVPQNVRVVRGIGMGLDENAVEAVKKYRFKPALRDGVPVKVEMNIQVNFQIPEEP